MYHKKYVQSKIISNCQIYYNTRNVSLHKINPFFHERIINSEIIVLICHATLLISQRFYEIYFTIEYAFKVPDVDSYSNS